MVADQCPPAPVGMAHPAQFAGILGKSLMRMPVENQRAANSVGKMNVIKITIRLPRAMKLLAGRRRHRVIFNHDGQRKLLAEFFADRKMFPLREIYWGNNLFFSGQKRPRHGNADA